MKKKLTLLLASAVILSACSSAPLDDIKKGVSENISGLIGGSSNDNSSGGGDSSAQDGDYIGSNVYLAGHTDFSNGRAWVRYDESERLYGTEKKWDAVDDLMYKFDKDNPLSVLNNGKDFEKWSQGDRLALIDTTGKIIWSSYGSVNSLDNINEFKDGLTYFILNIDGKKEYTIIDINGNVSFTKECSDDYRILGYGGGSFMVAQHISNFDTDEWQFGTIDKNGNIISPFTAYVRNPPVDIPAVEPPSGDMPNPNYDYWGYLDYVNQQEQYENYQDSLEYNNIPQEIVISQNSSEDGYVYSCEYVGGNIYWLKMYGYDVLLNFDTRETIYTSYTDSYYSFGKRINFFFSDFENGEAIIYYGDGDYYNENTYTSCKDYSICSISTDGTITETQKDVWTKYVIPKTNQNFIDGKMFVQYNYGTEDFVYIDLDRYSSDTEEARRNGFKLCTGAFYNYRGEIVADFPQYKDHQYFCSPFHNGCAVMLVEGADNNAYFTAVDESGKEKFEPISGYNIAFMSDDGRFITAVKTGSLAVYDINGALILTADYNRIKLPDWCSHSFSGWGFDTDYNEDLYTVKNGVLLINNVYINVFNDNIIGLYGDEFGREGYSFNMTRYSTPTAENTSVNSGQASISPEPAVTENTAMPAADTSDSAQKGQSEISSPYEAEKLGTMLDKPLSEIGKAFGAPLGGTPVYGDYYSGGEYYVYEGVSFIGNPVVWIQGSASCVSVNGTGLDKTRNELIKLLGTPVYDGEYVDESGEGFAEPYLIEFNIYESGINLSLWLTSSDARADKFSISKYYESYEYGIYGYVKNGTGVLNVRSGPGKSYDVIGKLKDMETVEIFSSSVDGDYIWYYILYNDNGEDMYGYVRSDFIVK